MKRMLLHAAAGVLATLAYSGIVSLVLLKLIALALPLRPPTRDEAVGLDVLEHGEEAYTSGEGAILVLPPSAAPTEPSTAVRPSPAAAASAAGV